MGIVDFSLEGKVALVSGGSRGIGEASAIAMAEAGADVVVASRKLPELERVAEEIRKTGRRGLAVASHADLDPIAFQIVCAIVVVVWSGYTSLHRVTAVICARLLVVARERCAVDTLTVLACLFAVTDRFVCACVVVIRCVGAARVRFAGIIGTWVAVVADLLISDADSVLTAVVLGTLIGRRTGNVGDAWVGALE